MFRALQQRPRAAECRIRVDEIGGRVHGAAHLARISVLILGMAVRAFALDVTVGQKHALHRVVELLDRLYVDQTGRLEPRVDVLRQAHVLRRISRMPVIETEVEAVEVAGPIGRNTRDQLLGRDPLGFGLEHDGRAVGVVGADEVQLVALHSLEAHPDVRLDVLHDVPDVERAIGVGERRGDEDLAGHPRLVYRPIRHPAAAAPVSRNPSAPRTSPC